ncbi:aromatic acid/H+ symport family MFS transporter [Citricoccus sp. K5]|uniref:MFS transporter n=1 Tax=Citricoccus sp. K5 TaxID=2653135 RepID=UPI0012EF271F|nr:aromatic acid/H+ symport family MFS transporter [Citricoccus sp. K5]VXB09753.1 Benzoate transport [Citricoccus sp. K5]
MATSTRARTGSGSLVLRGRNWVAPLCWFAVLLDGFDAVVLGAIMPMLTSDASMGIDNGTGTVIATAGLVGMMIGALGMGWLTDKFGRRKLLIGAVIAFSILTFVTGFAQDATTIGILRFLAGLGLGGCLPTGISMVTEFAGHKKGSNATTLMMTGYHVGAVITALLAIWAASETVSGWREMFFIGGLPALILVPLMWRYLPESPDFLISQGRIEEARRVADHYGVEIEEQPERAFAGASPEAADHEKQGAALLLSATYRRNTIFMWIASFMGLLLVYGLNTWLPQIMREADYDLGNSLGFLVVLNAGAVIGLIVAGKVGDAITPRNAAILWFIGSAILLAALAIKLPLLGIYVMIFITGCFVFSAQNLVYAFAATNYPPKVRGTALGMAAGVGRLGAISGPIMGGTLVAAGIAYPWGFFGFAVAGALGGVAVSGMRTMRRGQGRDQVESAPVDSEDREQVSA